VHIFQGKSGDEPVTLNDPGEIRDLGAIFHDGSGDAKRSVRNGPPM
jgi:hypothetical protein